MNFGSNFVQNHQYFVEIFSIHRHIGFTKTYSEAFLSEYNLIDSSVDFLRFLKQIIFPNFFFSFKIRLVRENACRRP